MRVLLTIAFALCLTLPALADDKKEQGDFSDLFGDALKGGASLDDVKEATDGVKARDQRGGGLNVKTSSGEGDGKIEFLGVFAAARIKVTRKEGCIPADPGRTRVTYLAFDELPEKSDPFSVCLSIRSKVSREIRVTTRIVDARNRRVGSGNDVIDFRGKDNLHHVLDFPSLTFPAEGKYFYVVEMDGKEAARLPLFDVKLLEEEG